MGSAGEFQGGELVTNRDGNFGGDKTGGRSDDDGTEDAVGLVG